jgi:hypothetical protein
MLIKFLPSSCEGILLQFLPLGTNMDNLMLGFLSKVFSLTCKDVCLFHTF